MTVIGMESTPNPSSFLLKLSAPIVGLEELTGTLQGRTFSTVTESTPKIISEILTIDGVDLVYCMATALTVNKRASAKWDVVLPRVIAALGVDKDQQVVLLQGLLSPSDNTAASSSTSAGQVRIRMQISNNIPIQIEAIGFLGTAKRMKLPPKFSEHMQRMVNEGAVDFLAGRKWVDRGLRYLETNEHDDRILDGSSQEDMELMAVLTAEVEEIDVAYSHSRLEAIVAAKLGRASVPPAVAFSNSSTSAHLDLESVEQYCDLADKGSEEALTVLANFVASQSGSIAARRNAIAFLGGTGSTADAVFFAVASAFGEETNPTMRRTAGDALSDLGDVRAIPYATKALGDRSKLVQWRAARILGELGTTQDVVAVLKQASLSQDYSFEVAFEIKDAMRKVRARLLNKDAEIGLATGPVWKLIQDGTRKDLGDRKSS
jgi:Scaffold protein Nfu/NifU N terminal/HEAT repeats